MIYVCEDLTCECHQVKDRHVPKHDAGKFRTVVGTFGNGPTIEGSVQTIQRSKREEAMSSIMTAEERAEFDKHTKKIRELNAEKRVSESVQEKIVEAVFLRFLQAGKWKVNKAREDGDVMRITPANDEGYTEKLIVNLLMETFNLDWHGSFGAFAPGVFIDGHVDDGRLTLYVDFSDTLASQKVQDGLASLRVDFDFGEMIKASMQEKLENLNRSIEGSVAARDQIIAKLKELE